MFYFNFSFCDFGYTFIKLATAFPVSKLDLTLTNIQKEAIVGNLLGDAHLRINKKMELIMEMQDYNFIINQ